MFDKNSIHLKLVAWVDHRDHQINHFHAEKSMKKLVAIRTLKQYLGYFKNSKPQDYACFVLSKIDELNTLMPSPQSRYYKNSEKLISGIIADCRDFVKEKITTQTFDA